MERSISSWVCVFALVALPVGGCSEETAATGGSGGAGDTGGDGGSGGMGGMAECESADDCDNENECTGSACGAGMCEFPPVADGTACDEDNECSVGMCAEGICPRVADDTPCGDDAGTCQQGSCRVACTEQGIRDAIAAGGGPYTFDCDGSTVVTTTAAITIDNDVILDGEGNLTVDGDEDHHVFEVAEVTVQLQRLTVSRGHGSDGAGIRNYGTLGLTRVAVSDSHASGKDSFGGGIVNAGTLTLTNSTVSGNSADVGGGIHNAGTLTLTSSTVSGNSADVGGGISNFGTLTLTSSTVSGNSADDGGGIFNFGTLTLTSSTVSGNPAGGILNSGTLTVTSSTVAGNGGNNSINTTDGTVVTLTNSLVDICHSPFGGAFISNGYNIESPGDTCGFDEAKGDQFNVTEGELNLGSLQDNGGPTETHALLPGSVAIDVIPADMCEVDTDQRGEPRPGGSMCDVGAFEVQP